MSEMPWSKFFWSDWESDQGLRLCSLAAQGLWMRMLCVCAKGDPRGYLAINGKPLDSTGVARLCGISAEEAEGLMEELDFNGVFSRDRRGWIYNRRMMKDAKKSATGKKFANKRWSQADENNNKKPRPNGVPTGAPKTQKPEARSQSKGGSYDPPRAKASRFPEFWDVYPHRDGKRNRKGAEAKYRSAVASGVQEQDIIDGAKRSQDDDRVLRGYARDPTTWLNQRGWEDEIQPPQQPQTLKAIPGGRNDRRQDQRRFGDALDETVRRVRSGEIDFGPDPSDPFARRQD